MKVGVMCAVMDTTLAMPLQQCFFTLHLKVSDAFTWI